MRPPRTGVRDRPVLVHVTTTDMSLALLLGNQLRRFADERFDVIGVSAPGPFVAELESHGIRHVALRHATRRSAPHHDVLAFLELWRLLRRMRPDVVHTHNPKPGIYGRLAARAAGTPAVVNTVHGLYALPEDPWVRRLAVYGVERLAASCSHAELVQNPEDLSVLRRLGLPESRLHLLGNGIDLARFDPARVAAQTRPEVRAMIGAAPDALVVGGVGRLVREKGYLELFGAAARIRQRIPDVQVVVVGPDDPDKADAISPAEQRRAEQAGVHFLGFRRDLAELYAAMDIYVLASHREGFPRSAMEAAAMGLPIVATDIRGCRQVVEDGATGLLVPAGDPVALAAAIERLARDPADRANMGRAGRQKALREFDEEAVIRRTLSVYETLVARTTTSIPE